VAAFSDAHSVTVCTACFLFFESRAKVMQLIHRNIDAPLPSGGHQYTANRNHTPLLEKKS